MDAAPLNPGKDKERDMDKATAIGCLVIGILAIICAGILWFHLFRDNQTHSKWVTLLAAIGAVGAGLGVGGLSQTVAKLASYSIGPIPIWIPVVVILGLIFLLQFMGNKDHHIRTPVIGIATALVLFMAVGHSLVNGASGVAHQVKPQTQSATVPKG